jgi:hypothetical protein
VSNGAVELTAVFLCIVITSPATRVNESLLFVVEYHKVNCTFKQRVILSGSGRE